MLELKCAKELVASITISPTKAITTIISVIAKIIATAIPIMSTFIITEVAIINRVMAIETGQEYSAMEVYFFLMLHYKSFQSLD